MAKNRYYAGPPSDHFDGTVFFNPSGTAPKGLRDLLKWQFATPTAKWPKAFPSPHADQPPARVERDTVRVSFIGHASYLIQGAGLSILMDPVFSRFASPVPFAGPRRINPPGIAFADLPKIDVVLVTHNHYDHMDMPTLKKLWARDRPRIVTPLGNDVIVRKGLGSSALVTAVDWHERVALGERVAIDTVPTQHWSARGMGDRCHALWASFVLQVGPRTIYAVGDSGLGDGAIFRAVAARHPRIDLALLPIGAYEPRWFMRDQHMNPDDAVQAFQMCGAERAVGHHWGTFKLTNEAIDAPRADLARALAERGVAADRFVAALPGAVIEV
jgi:L-ascorbate metabolism protein UlaG (beta-lactamase superfamily)